MMLQDRAATRADFFDVAVDLSAQTYQEVSRMDDPQGFFTLADNAVQDGRARALAAPDGKPLVLFGLNDFGGYTSMWTMATRRYFALGAAGVLATRRFLATLDHDRPMFVVTCSPHPDVGKWLHLLGFDDLGEEDGRRVFRWRQRCARR